MILARVEGHVVAPRKHESLEGWRILLCQPITHEGKPAGIPLAALDRHGAALHQRVLISSDGAAARKAVGNPHSPARMMIVAILDPAPGGPE